MLDSRNFQRKKSRARTGVHGELEQLNQIEGENGVFVEEGGSFGGSDDVTNKNGNYRQRSDRTVRYAFFCKVQCAQFEKNYSFSVIFRKIGQFSKFYKNF